VTARTVLITGCSTGIGRAAALACMGAGHTTYATARDVSDIAALEAAGCRVLPLDVTDEASMAAAVEAAGGVDALVNNAGYAAMGPVELVPVEDWRRQFETNVFGLVRMTQLVLPHMREQGWGRIVNLSSMGGELTFPLGGAYHATKYAVEALSDALRVEVAPFGVRVVVVQPGPIRSAFEATADEQMRRWAEGPYAAVVDGFRKLTRQAYHPRTAGRPEAVAKAIVRAIEDDRPPTRLKVTPQAHLLTRARRFTPDRVWDAAMSRSLPR
jgi:NAD(P)-dependent dehydrogenase (short-subunit alcohol dehydrogenase family)